VAGVKRRLTGHAIVALVCVSILALAVLWSWIDFHYGQHSGGTDIGSALVAVLSVLAVIVTLLVCLVAIGRRKARGLPAFRLTESETSFFDGLVPVAAAPVSRAPTDPLDPAYILGNPPPGAQATEFRGRRVVVLADGNVIGELLGGRAQRFPSLQAFRDFIGD